MSNLSYFASCTTAGVLLGLLLYETLPQDLPLVGDSASGTAQAVDVVALTPPADADVVYSSPSYHDGIMKVAPSVVSIYSSGAPPAAGLAESQEFGHADNGRQPDTSQGSGVIIDTNGLVLTNFHVIEGADKIEVVQSSGARHQAMLVGHDQETDLAVLSIAATDLPAVRIESVPRLRVGDIVLAIGNPFGVGQTVTQGIVSATGRQVAGGTAWQYFVQIDAAINPGNSGGALINPSGQLVGLNSAVLAGMRNAEGIGFAIPAELLVQVVPQLVIEGRVRRGWLGIRVDDLPMFPSLASNISAGAVVTSLVAGSPAAQAGLEALDVITAVNGQAIGSARGLMLLISSMKPDSDARLQVRRDSLTIDLPVTLGERAVGGAARQR